MGVAGTLRPCRRRQPDADPANTEREIDEIVYEAQQNAIRYVEPGMPCGEAYAANGAGVEIIFTVSRVLARFNDTRSCRPPAGWRRWPVTALLCADPW